MIHLIIIVIASLIGFIVHSLATYHKRKFSKIDLSIFYFLFISFICPILLLIFNFK